MSNQETLLQVLLKFMVDLGFSKRYYEFYEKCREGADGAGSQEDFEHAVRLSALGFKYNKKERFFSYKEKHPQCEVVFKIAYAHSQIEFILYVKTNHGYIGGPFAGLAHESEELSNPDFEYSPAYPTIPFSTREQAKEIVEWGISLFEDCRTAILAYKGWDGGPNG